MKRSQFFFALGFWMGMITAVSAQSFITGTIQDARAETPVPFATIGIKNKQVGVVSNLEGDFQIPLTYRSSGDTLMISCIGYKLLELPLELLSVGQNNIIKLERTDYALPEIVVESKERKPPSAVQLVRRAIRNIPKNYPQGSFSYTAYYRDYQRQEGQYVNLIEAIVEIVDQGFHTVDEAATQFKLYDYQSNPNFPTDPSTAIAYDNDQQKYIPHAQLNPFGGNELSILKMHDAIRNHQVYSFSFVNIFSEDFINNHKFELTAPSTIGESLLYVISFEGRRSIIGSKFQVEGKVFIEPDNYAIHKMVYSVYEVKEEEKSLMYEIQVEYSVIDELMYLNYISFNNLFRMTQPPIFSVQSINIDTTHSYTGYGNYAMQRNSIDIALNKAPEKTSALNKDNYDIRLDGRKLNITLINLGGGYSIRIYLKEEDMAPLINDISNWLPKLSIEFGDIYDLQGNKLNEPSYKEVHQYRELFRQQLFSHPTSSKSSDFIRKDTILSASLNQLISMGRTSDFWMNTPLKK